MIVRDPDDSQINNHNCVLTSKSKCNKPIQPRLDDRTVATKKRRAAARSMGDSHLSVRGSGAKTKYACVEPEGGGKKSQTEEVAKK